MKRLQDAEKVRQRHRPWRVKRETGEKGATWTDWIPTSSHPSRSSRMSRAAFFSSLPRRMLKKTVQQGRSE